MSEEGWSAAWKVYESACDLPPAERRRYVEREIPDPDLASRVLRMLDRLDEPEVSVQPEPSLAPPGEQAAEPSWLQPGQTFGRFRVGQSLGRGGMGEVFSAVDSELNRPVALKVLAPGAVGTTGAVDRLVREAQAASALNHPNIVTVHEVIRSPEGLAIVMELVEGEPLRMKCNLPHPAETVAAWGVQAARALAAAHSRGIVHRDIKPENLMLRADGYIKVLDFGLARHIDGSNQSSTGSVPMGTLRYMSPEQTRGAGVGPATDIFSLGLSLYELAAGVHPFASEYPLETAHRIVFDAAAPPSRHNPTLPPAFDSLMQDMLAKEPARRPSAASVAESLDPAVMRSQAKRRPWPRLRWIVGAAAVLIALLGGGLVWRARKPAAQKAPSRPVLLRSAPLTGLVGYENNPAFSPDGREIAYAWDGGNPENGRSIYVKLIGSGNPLRISQSGGAEDTSPTWSPDGTQIAFQRRTATAANIVIVPALGGAERVLGPVAFSQAFNRRYAAWSPDGQSVVAIDLVPGFSFNFQLFSWSLATGERKQITNRGEGTSEQSPAFSPDGNWLAYLNYEHGGSYEIFLSPARGGQPRMLTHSRSPINSFAWTADGRSILFGSGPFSSQEFWLVPVAGGEAVKAPYAVEGEGDQLAIAPRGNRLAYVIQNLDTNIYSVSTRPGEEPRGVIASTREDTDPDIAPDGSRIAFVSNRSGAWAIWVCDRDGANPRVVVTHPDLPSKPSWSPDGRQLAFDASSNGESAIWVVNADGGEPRRVIGAPWNGKAPRWSHDGRWLYFFGALPGGASGLAIWKVPVAGGEARRITTDGGYDCHETADGKYLYYTRDKYTAGIWRVPFGGGKSEKVPGTEAVISHRYWTLAGNRLYFAVAKPKPVIQAMDIETNRISRVAFVPKAPTILPRGLAVSEDGRQILYVQMDSFRQEIRLVENFPVPGM